MTMHYKKNTGKSFQNNPVLTETQMGQFNFKQIMQL